MAAVSKGFRTRAQLGLRAPRSFSANITPSLGGSAGHWNGGPVGDTSSHDLCERHWRADQIYHMDRQKWADIAYSGGFCQHGVCLAGRGFFVRTAANGSNTGNQSYYAFCWIGGQGETPTTDALNAFEWWVQEARLHGGAGMRVKPHNALFATACPGAIITARCNGIDNRVLTLPTPAPVTPTPPIPTVIATSLFEEDDMERLILALYRQVLGRVNPPGLAEVDGHLVQAAAKGLTAKDVYANFYNSAEAKRYRASKGA